MVSNEVVCYLFLGGSGAGACLFLAVLGLLTPKSQFGIKRPKTRLFARCGVASASRVYQTLFVPAYLIAVGALALGMLFLLLDLGQPDRALLLFLMPSLTYISIGAYSLTICLTFAIVLTLAWANVVCLPLAVTRAVQACSIAISAVVMVYTGLLLQSVGAVPLWATPWVPVLFVLSSLSCGAVIVSATAHFSDAAARFPSTLHEIVACDTVVIIVELAAVIAFVLTSLGSADPAGNETAAALALSMQDLVAGDLAFVFWGVFVIMGMLVPLAMELGVLTQRKSFSPRLPHAFSTVLASLFVLVGGLAMRYSIVAAAYHPLGF